MNPSAFGGSFGQKNVHRRISVAIGRGLGSGRGKEQHAPVPTDCWLGFPSGLVLMQRPTAKEETMCTKDALVSVVDVVFGQNKSTLSGLPHGPVSSQDHDFVVRGEALAPPQLVPALKGLVKGFQHRRGRRLRCVWTRKKALRVLVTSQNLSHKRAREKQQPAVRRNHRQVFIFTLANCQGHGDGAIGVRGIAAETSARA